MSDNSRQVECLAQRWDQVAGSPYRDLLRLALARDLAHVIHASISGALSGATPQSLPHRDSSITPARGTTEDLRALTERIEKLRENETFDFPLIQVLEGKLHSSPDSSAPPTARRRPSPAWLNAIGEEKLLRYDRHWECVLSAAAEDRGWSAWTATDHLPLTEVEAWNERFAERLFPQGIVLFCEKSPEPRAGAQAFDNRWAGRWSVLLEPAMGDPSQRVPGPAWARIG